MRDLGVRMSRLAIVLGAGLALAGCGGNETTTNTADLNNLDANALLEAPANDATAMEAAVNAVEPVVTTNTGEAGNASDGGDVLGETEGGDTGGNTVDSNTSGT
jgi:hypothetical protein